jgi:hypothetical protein
VGDDDVPIDGGLAADHAVKEMQQTSEVTVARAWWGEPDSAKPTSRPQSLGVMTQAPGRDRLPEVRGVWALSAFTALF